MFAGGYAVADDAAWLCRRVGRGAGGAEAGNQARQRNRIGGRERDDAPPEFPLGE